jgi:transcriptional regulator with XRE-family HTH domain
MEQKPQPADYPLAHTEATKTLSAALERVQSGTGQTQRDIARALGYKSSVVLSHMALGRVPIPLDRAEDIAKVLGLDSSRFLLATLQQRHPNVDFDSLFGVRVAEESALVSELQSIAGRPLDELPSTTKTVLRDVVASAHPERRWLRPAELATVELLRERRPSFHEEGLSAAERDFLRRSI